MLITGKRGDFKQGIVWSVKKLSATKNKLFYKSICSNCSCEIAADKYMYMLGIFIHIITDNGIRNTRNV